ncbi:hypothetical protein Y601_5665 [Burkholderia pseudomallei MSHR640]|nr:hypothetical protein Y601_5665 [Burkholderia pseudomallei MSHR640]
MGRRRGRGMQDGGLSTGVCSACRSFGCASSSDGCALAGFVVGGGSLRSMRSPSCAFACTWACAGGASAFGAAGLDVAAPDEFAPGCASLPLRGMRACSTFLPEDASFGSVAWPAGRFWRVTAARAFAPFVG